MEWTRKCNFGSASAWGRIFACSLALLSASPSFTASSATAADDWRSLAITACQRQGCDARLLIALGIVETGGAKDPDDTWHDDKVSWGRFGMQTATAAYHVYGPRFSHPGHLPAHLAIELQRLLTDPHTGPELAAQHLAWCQQRAWVLRLKARYRAAGAAACWNPKDKGYPRRVITEYRKLKP